MNSTVNETTESENRGVVTARSFKRPAIAITIALVAVLISCAVILHNWMYNSAPERSDDTAASVPKPWGQLEYTPLTIAPPLEFVRDPLINKFPEDVFWRFPKIAPARLPAHLKSIGLSAPFSEKLMTMARPDKAVRGSRIDPSRQFVLDVPLKDRTALYIALLTDPSNAYQRRQFQFRGSSPDEWFAASGVSPATRKLVEPLIYRRGNFMYFSDYRSIGDSISPAERSNLLKTLHRDATFLAHLKISRDSDIEALVRYWGRGGRANEVRPILEAMAQKGGEQSINITHLLPALARRKLYTYPGQSDLEKRTRPRDCHWTSMNFFNEEPDDSFCEGRKVVAAKMRDYYRVGGNLKLGDIVTVLTSRLTAVHSAVYIADDIIFHRCGPGPSAPWALARRKDIEAYYPSHAKYQIRYYRHKKM
ncbi:MAG: hypothetical protein HN350_13625 [Phycisphaerales bacterium]|nr:hypothetical protein [Phycisphaerales bacterium]